jgi:hypothetical protein
MGYHHRVCSRVHIIALVGVFAAASGLATPPPAGAVSLEEQRHETPPAVAELPLLGRVGSGKQPRLVIRGRLSALVGRRLVRSVRAVHADVLQRLGAGDASGRRAIQVCLFATTRDYKAFVQAVFGPHTFEDDLGFFSPYQRLVGVDLERRGEGVLRHELVHALLIDAPGKLPYWVEEGLAGLYVDAERTRAGFTFQAGHRLAELKRLHRAGRLPAFDDLAASDDRQVYGAGWRGYYALGRYVLLYLERRGELERFCRALRQGPRTPARQQRLLSRALSHDAFWEWVDGL